MEPILNTPRLTLIRLTDTDAGSQHAKWFYDLHSDEGATSWSLSGTMKTSEQALEHMVNRTVNQGCIEYAAFVKPQPSDSSDAAPLEDVGVGAEPGLLVGGVVMRKLDQALLPPPPPPSTATTDADASSQSEDAMAVHVITIGYGFKTSAWGKGYATEAGTALLEAIAAFAKKEWPTGFHYVEAGVGRKNLKSARVIEKLGLKHVGWKQEKEIFFLGGEWQEPGYNVYGRYLR
ncbi:hypothetical protein EJ04DRAFT_563077 [Polyplosphaeria fusca]|uniref:N-acetyltransferase domain-containing protein n=1 Tax=Polyplosphaeria fusca TaxID=682080 RepID=A0A9P4V2M2_9PLEO|nr:hypothetical protein EJ04DRAFT_563077 [Polyplosphaeria fusca]